MSNIKQYEPLWGSWYVDDNPLGEGSFGKVYKVHKEEFGRKYYAAVKIISLPQNQEDLNRARSEFNDDEPSVRSYFKGMVDDIVQEIDLMSIFRGNSNVVSLEDHEVVSKEGTEGWDSIGWDILIRMELLKTLSSYITERPLNTEDVMLLGIDISHALELCAMKNVIHRDIKPDNIFVSEYGDFKLGDFGVARHIARVNSEMSKKGTPTYMAPEVFNNQEYGASVDLYSLGIVMYRYLNKNRVPFMPPFPEPIKPEDREKALMRRMRGEEPLPDIPDIPLELNDFVLKACAFNPEERFKDATEFRTELERIAGVKSKAPIHEVEREPVRTEGKRPRAMRREEDERTTGVFVLKREETIAQVKEERPEVPAKITNVLAGTGAVFSGILTLLCLFSGRLGDVFASMPLYAMCVALCVLNFRLSALNLITIVWLVCYLAFSALVNFSAFNYSLLSLLMGIMAVEALRSKSWKYRRVLCITLIMCGAVSGILTYLTVSGSQVMAYRELHSAAYGIPVMMFITAVLVMLPHREDGRILAGLAALEIMPLIAFIVLILSAVLGLRLPVIFNIANANLVGFTPEKFSWWRYGRIFGVLAQVISAECLVLVASARMIPEDFLGMMANRKRAVLIFLASIVVISAGIFLAALI
ncbi:MAG: serine/threonine protein kinase [Synergistaceae bacterium]|nr:serine/threonine protein kinase [Synergistaceae bacterium]